MLAKVVEHGKNYTFGSDGKGNIKVIKKTSNANWEIRNYSDTGNKYVTNKKYFMTSSSKVDVIVDMDDFRMRIYNKSYGTKIVPTKKYIVLYMTSILGATDFEINNETVMWDDNGYILFNNMQKNEIIEALKNDNTYIMGYITESNSEYDYNIYEINISAKGFNEIYSSLF